MNGLAGAFLEVTDKDGDVINVLVTDLLPAGKRVTSISAVMHSIP